MSFVDRSFLAIFKEIIFMYIEKENGPGGLFFLLNERVLLRCE